MKTGKVSESILKRSILKQIKTKRSEVLQGAGVGKDCALFSFSRGEGTLVSTALIITSNVEEIFPAIAAAINNVAAAGGKPVGILVSAVLPESIYESDIQDMMAEVEKACHHLHIQAVGGHTQVSQSVSSPVLNITVIGKKELENQKNFYEYSPGQDIVLTKWVGLLGTSILARNHRKILEGRLPSYLIEDAIGFDKQVSVVPEAATAMKSGVSGMHDVSRGGIFAAIWELAEQAGVGLEIDLKKIPIRQETIEICEILEKNPYELYGAGALLIVCDKGNQLLGELEKQLIPAAIIGKITDDKGKVILNEDEKRFLDRPKKDELDSI